MDAIITLGDLTFSLIGKVNEALALLEAGTAQTSLVARAMDLKFYARFAGEFVATAPLRLLEDFARRYSPSIWRGPEWID